MSLNGACMAVHNVFDNRFYMNVWEHLTRPTLKSKFRGMVIFQPISPLSL